VRLPLRDRSPVLEHLKRSDVPVPVVYGDRDGVVPRQLPSNPAFDPPGGTWGHVQEVLGQPLAHAAVRAPEGGHGAPGYEI
jgi:hypothetical protein